MLIAVLSDIHANREAFEAVLAASKSAGTARLVILGDLVGYGADPAWCTDQAMELAERGAIILCGNHDQAVSDTSTRMNATAAVALDWTRRQLGEKARTFLANLPMEVCDADRRYVHAEASAPDRWNYVLGTADADAHFAACAERVSFCGHVHVPALYCTGPTNRVTLFEPQDATPIPLLPQRKWLAVVGSVGQPRDGNPAAAFCLLDTGSNELRFMRVPYDVELASEKIRAAGLPRSLADRLLEGR
ncbi:metallophosphoesterase family protein [Rhizobium sp. ARZ01]|uniref:metallophosphoesterase family protein n=1 Tax=Rhizobium sp. ARZ01 TaxID=2769313 RepID=UPI00177E50AE|nr:metallophosphoesterase family protein [Rhizobium sp. ARZ01]MBD9372451.1 metallophosphoesterase family protein [Rhizobium sp. ARZ01]